MSSYRCEKCGAKLKKQKGFDPDCFSWMCTKCGHVMFPSFDNSDKAPLIELNDDIVNCSSDRDPDSLSYSDSYEIEDNSDSYEIQEYDDDYYPYDENPESSAAEMIIGLGVSAVVGLVGATKVVGEAVVEQYRIDKEMELKRETAARERAERRRDKRFEFYKRHWKGILLLFAVISVSIVATYYVKEYQKGREVGISSEDIIGMDYEEAIKILEKSGFKTFYSYPLEDLSIGEINMENTVSTISIKGDTVFSADTIYPYDSRIEILYHVVKNIQIPLSSKDMKKMNYNELKTVLREAGFIDIELKPDYDLITGWIRSDGSVETVSIDYNTKIKKGASYRPDVKIIIEYHAMKNSQER